MNNIPQNDYDSLRRDDVGNGAGTVGESPQARGWKLYQKALAYAKRGMAVIPLHTPTGNPDKPCSCGRPECRGRKAGKDPRTPHGYKDATTDAEQIGKWWRDFRIANIGIVTGTPSRLAVLDVDMHGVDGRSVLHELEAQHGALPDTWRVTTHGGGIHYYFRIPEGVTISGGTLDYGIDLKAEGGYVVAPPSLHPLGGHYEWEQGPDDLPEPAPLPEWIAARYAKDAQPADQPPPPTKPITDEEIAKAREALGRLNQQRCDDYWEWLCVGMALRDLGSEGLKLWDEWSRKSVKYQEGCCAKKWPTFASATYHGKRITIASLFHWANEDTPQHKNNGNGSHTPKDGTQEEAKAGKRKSQATELFELARDQLDLWNTPEGDAFAGTRDGIHVFRIKDGATLQWLSRLHYEATGNAPSDDTLRTAHKQLIAEAAFNAPTRPTYVRVAPEGAEADPVAIWVDLADGTGRAVRITAQGWDVVPSPSVALWRPEGMLALPEPVRGHDDALQDLFAMFHMEESAQSFVSAFLVDALRPTGPYPILQVHGEQGSGKSTLCTFLVNLIDPRDPALRSPHQNEEDMVITARRAHLVAYTNVSTIPAWFADALCRLTTDGGFSRRQRYTDDEEVTFKDRRPVILNGIPDLTHVARRGDLADRTLRVSLDPIPDDRRRVDAELQQRYAELRPRILGALYTRVSRALAKYHAIRLPSLPRLATTAVWVTASEPDAEAGTFLHTFYKARDLEAQAAIQDDPIATAIVTLADQGGWHGTARDLLERLNALVPTAGDKAAHFPRDARVLGTYIARIAPLLRKVGVDVSKARNEAQRTITICRTLAMTGDDKA
jgi:hypothetical protein